MFVIACFVRLMIIDVYGYNVVSFYSIFTCYIFDFWLVINDVSICSVISDMEFVIR